MCSSNCIYSLYIPVAPPALICNIFLDSCRYIIFRYYFWHTLFLCVVLIINIKIILIINCMSLFEDAGINILNYSRIRFLIYLH